GNLDENPFEELLHFLRMFCKVLGVSVEVGGLNEVHSSCDPALNRVLFVRREINPTRMLQHRKDPVKISLRACLYLVRIGGGHRRERKEMCDFHDLCSDTFWRFDHIDYPRQDRVSRHLVELRVLGILSECESSLGFDFLQTNGAV